MRSCFVAAGFAAVLTLARAQTLNLHAQLTLGKNDDKSHMLDEAQRLYGLAKKEKLDPALLRFVDNMVKQLTKVREADKIVQEKKDEVPTTFTTGKYKLKTMTKLRAKKQTVKTWTIKQLNAALKKGNLDFKQPFVVRNAQELFPKWDEIRRHWTADRLRTDEQLEQNFRMDYFPPDQARARLVGNQIVMQPPSKVPFSRYFVLCNHGTPANPRIPGQATEHCEQTVGAKFLASPEELDALRPFKNLENYFQSLNAYRQDFVQKGNETIHNLLGDDAKDWIEKNGRFQHQQFVFGPAGSGDKLHAENGLPFYDVLIHGSRRWLILGEEELNKVAQKAREALEFQKTSAYMFFEDKLPELKEEFGLKKFVECNQDPGDVIFIPPGWFRVSLSLADSISFYEQMLHDKSLLKAITNQNLWFPQFQQFNLGYCYAPENIKPNLGSFGDRMDSQLQTEFTKINKDRKTCNTHILQNMIVCGGVLALRGEVGWAKGLTMCDDNVWKNCRERLVLKSTTKKREQDLSWLPETAPKAIPVGEKRAKNETAVENEANAEL